MDVGPLTIHRIHKTRKQIAVYLILLVILVPTMFLRQELKVESIPVSKNEKLYETAQSNDVANFSIINNEFNIFYKNIIIKDDLAFINNKYSIVIYNITNPEEPKILSESARCTNEILKMQVEGDTLFIGFNFLQSNYFMTKIQAFNISEPTIIESVGCFIYYDFYDFVIKDNYGYLTTIGDGMLIFSVQDPTNMYTVGEYGGLSNSHYKIAVSENYSILYTNYNNDLTLFVDISDKENPILASIGFDYYHIVQAQIQNDTLFLLSTGSLISVNISNMYSPQYLTSYSSVSTGSFYINEGYVYLTGNSRMLIVDARDPSDFDFITYHMYYDLNVSVFSSMDFYENYTLFTCGSGGIAVFNTTGFIIFSKISQSGLDGGKDLQYENDLCYILESHMLYVMNASNLSNLTLISSYELDYSYDLQIENNRAYILTNYRVEILNISDPTNITKIGEVTVADNRAFKVHDNLLAVVGTFLYVFNVTIPNSTSLLDDEYLNYRYITSIEMTNETIMLTDYGSEILLYDYSNPFNIQPLDTVQVVGYHDIQRFFLHENYLFGFSYYDDVIIVLNITDIQTASVFILEDFSYGVYDLFVENDVMYVSTYDSAVTAYNISNILDISLFGETDLLSQPFLETGNRLFVENKTIFLLNVEGALQIVGMDSDSDYLADYLEEKVYFTTTGSKDSDSDLIFDGYEIHYGLNPLSASDASEDFDEDNLTNLEEFQYFSNPRLSDSDFDCLLDEEEITIYNTNIASYDTDSDLLVDGFEVYLSLTSPVKNDTDNDRLLDGEEVLDYLTDPLDNDTDSDSMDDYYEVHYNLDPLDPSDRDYDLDMDGLLNYEEYQYNTRPDNADSDFDFYTDFEEIEYGSDPLDPLDFPDYPRTLTTSFAGYEELTVFISTIFVSGFVTLIIRLRKNRGVRVD